jgi:two-component system osmolarity sensor histidine kinase EnvZ
MQLELEMAGLQEDAREGMRSDLDQMDAIIGQFLDYARPSDSTHFSSIDVSALLAEAAHEAARSPDIKVGTEIAEHVEVMGHAIDLKRVVNNLVENARRYGRTPGGTHTEIDLCCRVEGHQVIIEVADRGPGVPEGEIDRLLRPFTRMDTARGQANGAGLGLAIVHRIVLRHGATLRLHNREGGGLSVQLVFPAPRKTRPH